MSLTVKPWRPPSSDGWGWFTESISNADNGTPSGGPLPRSTLRSSFLRCLRPRGSRSALARSVHQGSVRRSVCVSPEARYEPDGTRRAPHAALRVLTAPCGRRSHRGAPCGRASRRSPPTIPGVRLAPIVARRSGHMVWRQRVSPSVAPLAGFRVPALGAAPRGEPLGRLAVLRDSRAGHGPAHRAGHERAYSAGRSLRAGRTRVAGCLLFYGASRSKRVTIA